MKVIAIAALTCSLLSGCRDDNRNVERFDGVMDWDGVTGYRQVGVLVDGKKEGPWRIYKTDSDQLEAIQHWRDGLRHGPLWAYNDDGGLLFDQYYWKGKLHGRMRTFLGGELAELGWAADNRREGEWCHWDDNDRLYKIAVWSRDNQRHDRTEEWPRRPCPHLERAGRRHADPRDQSYHWPRQRRGSVYRPL